MQNHFLTKNFLLNVLMGDKFVPRGTNFVPGEKFVPRRTNLSPMAEFCPGPTQRLREATSGVKIVPFCIPNGFGVKKLLGVWLEHHISLISAGDKFVHRRRILSPDLPVIPRSHINERNCSFLSSQWICSPKIMNLGSILCSGGQNLSPGGQNLSPGGQICPPDFWSKISLSGHQIAFLKQVWSKQ